MFKSTSLRFKMLVGFSIITLFVAIAGGVGYWGSNTLGKAMTQITDEEAPIVNAQSDSLNDMVINLASLVHGSRGAGNDNPALLKESDQRLQLLKSPLDES